jgi:hypothetical protein
MINERLLNALTAVGGPVTLILLRLTDAILSSDGKLYLILSNCTPKIILLSEFGYCFL